MLILFSFFTKWFNSEPLQIKRLDETFKTWMTTLRAASAARILGIRNLSRGDKEAVTLSEFPNRRSRRDQINFFTIAEVAERLRVSTRTVRRWMDAGDLVAHRLGGTIRIAEGDLRAFLAQHREG